MGARRPPSRSHEPHRSRLLRETHPGPILTTCERVKRPRSAPARCLWRLVPMAGWSRSYESRWLRGDLIAGVAVAALIIPKNPGYAGIAGIGCRTGYTRQPAHLASAHRPAAPGHRCPRATTGAPSAEGVQLVLSIRLPRPPATTASSSRRSPPLRGTQSYP